MKRWILPFVELYKGRMALNVLFAVLGIGSGAMLLFLSGYLISKTSLQPENILLVYVPIVAVRAFSISQAVFPYLEKLVGHHIVLKILAHYRNMLYEIIEPQALMLESRYRKGDLLSVSVDDIEKLQDFYIRTLFPAVSSVVIYAAMVATFGIFDLGFMLLMMALLGIMIFLVPLLSYSIMKRRHTKIKQKRTALYQHVTDALFGQLDWMVSGRVDELKNRTRHDDQALQREESRVHQWHLVRDIALRLVAGGIIISTMIWVNMQVNEQAMSKAVIAAFVLMMFSVTDALLPASPALEEAPVYMESVRRMNQLCAGESEAEVQKTDAFITEKEPSANPVLHMENLHYQYQTDEADVIDNVNWTIAPGEKIALLGKSGSGKSTLLKLLAGVLNPKSGRVLLDGSTMTEAYLGKKVSVLNQHPHLFNTTIVNNVRIGREDATEDEIVAALEQAQMMDVINTLPKGIHTQMEEMGKRFSGGERHRIAFARLLVQNTPILLLDEPTTGLDPVTEQALLTTMLDAAVSKTVVLVTHHLASAELMDEIVFLENGKIKRSGSHRKLMAESKAYRTLYEMDTGIPV